MGRPYFSDREKGPRPRTTEAISDRVWGALYDLVHSSVENGSFGHRFPETCPDGAGCCGTDRGAFWRAVQAEIPDIGDDPGHLSRDHPPEPVAILDFLEFCARSVAKPIQVNFHPFFRHWHLSFEREPGLADFVSSVNRLFARNGIAFELTPDGHAERLGPPGLREELRQAVFHTGDADADSLLEEARRRILSPHVNDRQDAIEKLWDAFERIKTLEPGPDKKAQAKYLLDHAVPEHAPKFRQFLETEAHELTKIGNTLRIRHAETDKEPLYGPEQVDCLFHRMFSFIRLVLRATNRGG